MWLESFFITDHLKNDRLSDPWLIATIYPLCIFPAFLSYKDF
jgi:hypothetical protein